MKLNYKLKEGFFIKRPNRFLTLVKLGDKIVESHLPDPGRLKELLIPGAKVLLKDENGKHRKTKFSTQAV
jgi:sugar fermentation stimulation protein A